MICTVKLTTKSKQSKFLVRFDWNRTILAAIQVSYHKINVFQSVFWPKMRHFIVKNALLSVFSLDLNEFDINEVFLEPIIRLNRGIGVLSRSTKWLKLDLLNGLVFMFHSSMVWEDCLSASTASTKLHLILEKGQNGRGSENLIL